MVKRFEHKIFTVAPPASAIDVYGDWLENDHVNWNFTDDYQEALSQPYKIAMMPALFNVKGRYNSLVSSYSLTFLTFISNAPKLFPI